MMVLGNWQLRSDRAVLGLSSPIKWEGKKKIVRSRETRRKEGERREGGGKEKQRRREGRGEGK